MTIDSCLNFKIDQKERNAKLKKIKQNIWPNWNRNFTGNNQWLVWKAFIDSRMTYSIVILTEHSSTMNIWAKKYFYTAICSLLNTRLKPQTEHLYKLVTGGTADDFIKDIKNKKCFVNQRLKLVKYNEVEYLLKVLLNLYPIRIYKG